MQLYEEYNQQSLGPIQSWARLTLPDNELPHLSSALKQYTQMPWHLGRNTLYKCLLSAADMAAAYFDQNVCPTEQKRKYLTRFARLQESVENNDGSLLFIRNGEKFLGYTRVMPISTEQWEAYYDDRKISEAEFIPQSRETLETGHAHIYIQAIVFPNGDTLGPRNKLALQETALAGLIGNLLPNSMPAEGINVYFTAFHPYTDKFANRLKIPPVGHNKSGCTIYGFNISQYASEHSLGRAIFNRWKDGKQPFNHLKQESLAAPTHPRAHSPDHPHGLEATPKVLFTPPKEP